MEKLPASQRQCMALAYDLGLSHAEVAAHLALPLGTVKCRLRRAHLALRQRLEPQFH
ncbi:hypothetical protein FSC37_06535 [Piscinibacter aquaticus]|uniref:RNA polymerase sigma factor 70 region 4 type 2 domain-containing protein n=1 Tax=Piscinibacter aquaticus TaxID=392597 RepID=A0A5C6U1K2_9BURK|nr:hypothetical protein FSC37_06535 [Piscinibacter aquaticus]